MNLPTVISEEAAFRFSVSCPTHGLRELLDMPQSATMALGMSFPRLTTQHLTQPTLQDQSLAIPQSDPRSDPNFHTAHPDNHPPPTIISPTTPPPEHSSSFMDGPIHHPTPAPPSPDPDASPQAPAGGDSDNTAPANRALTPDVDPQIMEALKSKDRIYVLKLGETFEALIMEHRSVVLHLACNGHYRVGLQIVCSSCVSSVHCTDPFSPRQRVELSPATSYQRLLVHRCSAYYKLTPESDPVTKAISVLTTSDSRMYVFLSPVTPLSVPH